MKKVENPKLNAVNPHFGNRYADLGEVLRVVEAALESKEHIYQTVLEESPGCPYFRTQIIKDGAAILTNHIPFIVGKQDPQGVGSALTYYRRYGLVLLFNLVAEEDDDGNAATPRPKKKETSKPKEKKAAKPSEDFDF